MQDGMKKQITDFEIINELLPAARIASKLRACGIRIVGEPRALEALRGQRDDGNVDAGEILANLFRNGHPEVSGPGR